MTQTEQNILRMVVGHMSDGEIGFALDISEPDIKTQIENILGKIGVYDRASAATMAVKRGLVRIDL